MPVFAFISRLFAILYTMFCLYLVPWKVFILFFFCKKNKQTHLASVTKGNLPSKAESQTIILPSLKITSTSNTLNEKPICFFFLPISLGTVNLFTQRLYQRLGFNYYTCCDACFVGYS